jgi:multidrug efflux system outer membrane protein
MHVLKTHANALAAALLFVLLSGGCMIGPEPARPATAARDAGAYESGRAEPAPVIGPWWRRFGDPATTQLVEEVLAGNTDLRAASARVREAAALYQAAGGRLLPSVQMGLSGQKQKFPVEAGGLSSLAGGAGGQSLGGLGQGLSSGFGTGAGGMGSQIPILGQDGNRGGEGQGNEGVFIPPPPQGGGGNFGQQSPGGGQSLGGGLEDLGGPTTTYTLDASVRWQVDLWGKLRRSRQAAEFSLLANEESRLALMHTLAAQAVKGRVNIAALDRRLELTEENVEARALTLDTVEKRYKAGLVDAGELYLARNNLSSLRAQLPQLQAQRTAARHALDVLRGMPPGSGERPPPKFAGLPELPPPPPGLPASLLDRRPDLRASELRAKAQTAQVGVEMADLFPSLTLTASGGYASDSLDRLVRQSNEFYTLIGSIAQSVFYRGVELNQIEAARARAEEAAAEYAGAVLQAMQEVEDALVRERAAREALVLAREAFQEAILAEEQTRRRYISGLTPLVRLLEAEQRRRRAEESVVQLEREIWNTRVNLHLALGGDWDLDAAEGLRPAHETSVEDVQETEREGILDRLRGPFLRMGAASPGDAGTEESTSD